jgi:hypothetical protein
VKNPELTFTDTTSIGLLAPGAWKLISIAGKIEKKLTNNAVVTAKPSTENGSELPMDDVTSTDPSGVDILPYRPSVSIRSSVYLGNDGGAACGTSALDNVKDIYFTNVTYCFAINNTGDTRLENVVLNNKALNMTNWPVQPLEPGQVAYVSVPSKILVDLTNTAIVTATPTAKSCQPASPPKGESADGLYTCTGSSTPLCSKSTATAATWTTAALTKTCCDYGYKFGIRVAEQNRCSSGSLVKWTTILSNGGFIEFECSDAYSVQLNSTGQHVDLLVRKTSTGGERYCMKDSLTNKVKGNTKYSTSQIDVCWDATDIYSPESACFDVPGLSGVQDQDTSSVTVLNFEANVQVENQVSRGIYQPETTCGTPLKPPTCQKPDSVYSCPMSNSPNPICKANPGPTWAEIGNLNCCDFGYNTGIKVADDGSCGSGVPKQWTTCLPNGGIIDLACKTSTSVSFQSTGQKIDLLFRKAGKGGERYCLGDALSFETSGNSKFGTSHVDICWDTTDKYVTDGYNTCIGNTPVEKVELVDGLYSVSSSAR